MDDFLAHTNPDSDPHSLHEHLTEVAAMARSFAEPLGFGDWAHIAGLWHDLGKYRPGFQRYIRQVDGFDAHLEGKWPARSEKTHSIAGARHALHMARQHWGEKNEPLARALAYVIGGHHTGLGNWSDGIGARLQQEASTLEYQEAHAACQKAHPELLDWPSSWDVKTAARAIPFTKGANPLAQSIWIRMLFSSLIDADFLDTERYMNPPKFEARQQTQSVHTLWPALQQHLSKLAQTLAGEGRDQDLVMRLRAEVLQKCRDQALLPPGVFTLSVPTGGGKTLSSLAFALQHAVAHQKQRVIYAIPYTSILEQTADVFKGIFGTDAVIEHHSQVEVIDDKQETSSSRLACENWDAPLIVTTNVQLFESLFAARTSRCRKLHNVANSVIVLDEAQLLPPAFLQPILDALNVLVTHYGVTLVLCTATQPVLTDQTRFDSRKNLRGLPQHTPIVDDESALFTALRRVQVQWPADLNTAISIDELLPRLLVHDCVLVIVNTRADALEITQALDAATGQSNTLHLSTTMCGQHRADVISHIRKRLQDRREDRDTRPLRVVSTQLVEAGVDIDFPVVFRALAGLDSIAQAAGRCNREGILPAGQLGQVVVFVREIPKLLHEIRDAVHASRSVLSRETDLQNPAIFKTYFSEYYASADLDKNGIVDFLKTNSSFEFEFKKAAEQFKLIDDEDKVSIIVPYQSPDAEKAKNIQALIEKLRKGEKDRWLFRQMQRYIVQVHRHMINKWVAQKDISELGAGMDLYVLNTEMLYHPRWGLDFKHERLAPDKLVP